MHEWFASLPWWSLLAVLGACLAGSAWRAWAVFHRPDAVAELKSVEEFQGLVIGVMAIAYLLLPNPRPGTIDSIIGWLAATGLLVLMFVPARRRVARMSASNEAIAHAMLTDVAVPGVLVASIIVSAVVLSCGAVIAVSRGLLSAQWASLLVVIGVCVAHGATLLVWAVLGPKLVAGDGGARGFGDGILFDMAEAAFGRAGLPAPRICLIDGSLDNEHGVGYLGLTAGPVKPLLFIEVRLLSRISVRELSAVLRHEASHAARHHAASMFTWKWLMLAIPGVCAWLAGVTTARYAPSFEFIAAAAVFAGVFLPVYLYAMRLSRCQEMDADADAVFLYGAEPQAMLDAIKLIEGLNGNEGQPGSWEPQTHPNLAERAAELRRRAGVSAS